MPEDSLQLTKSPKMQTQMLIRKPAHDVFEAFINPDITTKFWFTKASAPLSTGATVTWQWEMYGVSVEARVKAFEQDTRLAIQWGSEQNGFTDVEWRFEPRGHDATFVTITESGYSGTGDEVVARAIDSMGGFSFTLAGAKAWLEHGIPLKLIEDHAPDHLK